MRLLFVLPSVPDPPTSGAKMRNLVLLNAASRGHDVAAVAFGSESEAAALRQHARAAWVLPTPRRSTLRRIRDLTRPGWPDMAGRLWSDALVDQVAAILRDQPIDAVQVEGVEMGAMALRARARAPRPVPLIYDAHNAEFLLQRRAAETAPAGAVVARLYSRLQWQRLTAMERSLVRASAVTLAVSTHDANQLEALVGAPWNVQVVRNGVDPEHFRYQPPEGGDRPQTLLFVGKLDFRPNAEAVRWLVDDVLPRLHSSHPEARLMVVGASPPDWLVRRGQHDDRIAVVGPVPDERPYLHRSTVMVIPLHVGVGSRLKALVAFAAGLPVVSTPLGMEGLEAEPGRHYRLASGPTAFAAACATLLDDLPARVALASEARALVEACYTPARVEGELLAAYRTLAQRA